LFEVQKPLIELLKDLEGVDVLLEQGKQLPNFDYQCPLLSLPLAFKTELNSIPSPTPYLQSNAEKIMVWNQRLGEKSKPRIGLVWSGSTIHKNDHNRSLTLTDVLKHLPPNFEYVSLQKEVREGDKDALIKSTIKHFGDQLVDFTDTAALCDLMDIVISVDTSVAHLAGALGKTTWILLPYMPDWRWLLDRDDSPWYASVKLYRQGEDRQYAPVLGCLRL
jgi:ADP-heptose:LPS heptosyltransferase